MLSYPFFDPVLTDRTFLASPKTMLKSFIVGGTLAAGFIVMFSFIGVYGNMEAAYLTSQGEATGLPVSLASLQKGVPSSVSRYISRACFTLVNIVMLTSSISTLDSTFSSVAKLVGPELMSFLRTNKPGTTSQATMRDIGKYTWQMYLLLRLDISFPSVLSLSLSLCVYVCLYHLSKFCFFFFFLKLRDGWPLFS